MPNQQRQITNSYMACATM